MDYNEIRFEFIENDNIGLSKEQIGYIRKLIMQYVEKYPLVILKKVCDFEIITLSGGVKENVIPKDGSDDWTKK